MASTVTLSRPRSTASRNAASCKACRVAAFLRSRRPGLLFIPAIVAQRERMPNLQTFSLGIYLVAWAKQSCSARRRGDGPVAGEMGSALAEQLRALIRAGRIARQRLAVQARQVQPGMTGVLMAIDRVGADDGCQPKA